MRTLKDFGQKVKLHVFRKSKPQANLATHIPCRPSACRGISKQRTTIFVENTQLMSVRGCLTLSESPSPHLQHHLLKSLVATHGHVLPIFRSLPKIEQDTNQAHSLWPIWPYQSDIATSLRRITTPFVILGQHRGALIASLMAFPTYSSQMNSFHQLHSNCWGCDIDAGSHKPRIFSGIL